MGKTKKEPEVAALVFQELKVMTWNVWFLQIHYNTRMQYILDTTLNILPDVVCFQEVLPDFAAMIHSNAVVKEHYEVSPFNITTYGVLTLVKSVHKPMFETFEFPTNMGRELLRALCTVNGKRFVVGNVHLESLNSQSTRAKQLKVCNQHLSGFDSALLVGDFNFCSERNYYDIVGIPLDNQALAAHIPSFTDTWPLLASRGQISTIPGNGIRPRQEIDTSDVPPIAAGEGSGGYGTPTKTSVGCSTPVKGSNTSDTTSSQRCNIDKKGYTFDSEVNPMIGKFERMRYDRIMAKLGK